MYPLSAAGLGEVLAQLVIAAPLWGRGLDRQSGDRPSLVYQCTGRRIASAAEPTPHVHDVLIAVRGQHLRCLGGPAPDLAAYEQLRVVGIVGLHDREKLRIRSLLTRGQVRDGEFTPGEDVYPD